MLMDTHTTIPISWISFHWYGFSLCNVNRIGTDCISLLPYVQKLSTNILRILSMKYKDISRSRISWVSARYYICFITKSDLQRQRSPRIIHESQCPSHYGLWLFIKVYKLNHSLCIPIIQFSLISWRSH